MFNSSLIEKFIEGIRQLPNVSRKQAEKIVLWILKNDASKVGLLANSFKNLKEKVIFCPLCQSPSEVDFCQYCDDVNRENKLLVVDNFAIIEKIEKGQFYKGKYYTFKNLMTKEENLDQTLKEINSLKFYAQKFDEVILAISPNLSGEMTNILIKKEFKDKQINISQLAIGIPIGASIDYIDEMTLKFSLINRQK
ncbi:toprim domain-containing protein [Mycoplasmopsis cricetuli]|uniref:toprim domain-containing protein n=1 Tax=Mycoplasmopsis cricetuli TaxID=171283 RepID=UPI0004705B37|nr:toprim domain-containing protein [Mycoplasmopsis cricetuli]